MCTCQDCAGAQHTTDTTCHEARHAEGTVQVLLGAHMLRKLSRSCLEPTC